VFDQANICNSFAGAGLKLLNEDQVLGKITFQLRTPTPPLIEGSIPRLRHIRGRQLVCTPGNALFFIIKLRLNDIDVSFAVDPSGRIIASSSTSWYLAFFVSFPVHCLSQNQARRACYRLLDTVISATGVLPVEIIQICWLNACGKCAINTCGFGLLQAQGPTVYSKFGGSSLHDKLE
jgi:hypothetical protein